jgi:hypothetical protein
MFGKQLNSWEYSMISGIETKQTMTTKSIVLQVSGAPPVTKFGRFDSGPQSVWEAPNAVVANISNFEKVIGTLRRLVSEYQNLSRQPNATVGTQETLDPVEQIRQWAALRDQGLLTDEEFQHQKRKLLGM